LLQSLSSSGLCFLGSLLDLLGHFYSCLRSVRSLNGLGLLLDSLGLFLDSPEYLCALRDLSGHNGLIILSLGLLSVFSLNNSLLSLNGGLITRDFVLDLRFFSLGLDDNLLFSEFLDLLLSLGDGLGAGLDLLLRFDLDNSVGILLSLVLSCLTISSLFGLGDSVSMRNSILFDLNDSVLVGVLVVSSSNSVN